MKKDLHPTYFAQATVTCACGNTFKTGSTKEEIQVEICSQCHPFMSGKEKTVDSAGRVDKFKKQQEAAAKKKSDTADKKAKKSA